MNPNLLIEVASPSSEGYDRGLKFEMYRTIASLSEYMLVSQDRMHVDLFTRQADGNWHLLSFGRPEDALELPSVGCKITLADIYEKVDLGLQAPV